MSRAGQPSLEPDAGRSHAELARVVREHAGSAGRRARAGDR